MSAKNSKFMTPSNMVMFRSKSGTKAIAYGVKIHVVITKLKIFNIVNFLTDS